MRDHQAAHMTHLTQSHSSPSSNAGTTSTAGATDASVGSIEVPSIRKFITVVDYWPREAAIPTALKVSLYFNAPLSATGGKVPRLRIVFGDMPLRTTVEIARGGTYHLHSTVNFLQEANTPFADVRLQVQALIDTTVIDSCDFGYFVPRPSGEFKAHLPRKPEFFLSLNAWNRAPHPVLAVSEEMSSTPTLLSPKTKHTLPAPFQHLAKRERADDEDSQMGGDHIPRSLLKQQSYSLSPPISTHQPQKTPTSSLSSENMNSPQNSETTPILQGVETTLRPRTRRTRTLVRTSLMTKESKGRRRGKRHLGPQEVQLTIDGDLNDVSMGWGSDEPNEGRRLVQFWRKQNGPVISLRFERIDSRSYKAGTTVASCIFRGQTTQCCITSVDLIHILELIIGARFIVPEKNRIRRNLEGLKPETLSKNKNDLSENDFFSQVMLYEDPRPRNIEKDVKVFAWASLQEALEKIVAKYSFVAQDTTLDVEEPSSDEDEQPHKLAIKHKSTATRSSPRLLRQRNLHKPTLASPRHARSVYPAIKIEPSPPSLIPDKVSRHVNSHMRSSPVAGASSSLKRELSANDTGRHVTTELSYHSPIMPPAQHSTSPSSLSGAMDSIKFAGEFTNSTSTPSPRFSDSFTGHHLQNHAQSDNSSFRGIGRSNTSSVALIAQPQPAYHHTRPLESFINQGVVPDLTYRAAAPTLLPPTAVLAVHPGESSPLHAHDDSVIKTTTIHSQLEACRPLLTPPQISTSSKLPVYESPINSVSTLQHPSYQLAHHGSPCPSENGPPHWPTVEDPNEYLHQAAELDICEHDIPDWFPHLDQVSTVPYSRSFEHMNNSYN